MTYEEFLHAIRAAASVASTDEFLVFGSQAILVHDPDPPLELRQSIELDVVPTKVPERWEDIDGVLGDLSLFHSTHGFYVHGVESQTAVFPHGWKKRCIRVHVGKPAVTVVCPELHDLAASKLAAGRDKDFSYVSVLLHTGYVKSAMLLKRVDQLPIDAEVRTRLRAWIASVASNIADRSKQSKPPTP
ncbi:MAG: DUF6036 family nucleotidyltransferase [Gemmatimonadaceae bacterium]